MQRHKPEEKAMIIQLLLFIGLWRRIKVPLISRFPAYYSTVMQALDELEPTVRIRELKKDRVNFVLENVDLAYDRIMSFANRTRV